MAWGSITRAATLALAWAACFAAGADPAAASTTPWPPRQTEFSISAAGGWSGGAQVASSRQGEAAIAWVQRQGSAMAILTTHRTADGVWSKIEVAVSMYAPEPTADWPVPLVLKVDDAGTTHLLWGTTSLRQRPDVRLTVALSVAERPRGERWRPSTTLMADDAERRLSGDGVDMVVTPDHTVVALWSASPTARTRLPATDPPDTAYVAERKASGAWTAPSVVGPSLRNVGIVGLAANRTGGVTAAIATTAGPKAPDGRPMITSRTPVGGWGPSRTLSTAPTWLGRPLLAPVLGEDGVTHLLREDGGLDSEVNGLTYLSVGPDGRGRSVRLPDPTTAEQRSGRLAHGDIRSVDMELDAHGTPVVAYGSAPGGNEIGASTNAIWVASRGSEARWRVRALDPFAESTDATSPTLDRAADGRLVAMWSTPVHGARCGLLIYRATRTVNGRWSKRVAAGYLDAGKPTRLGCDSVGFGTTDGVRPLLFRRSETAGLSVIPALTEVPRAAASATIVAGFRSWQDVEEGGMRFTCRSRTDGFCSVSILPSFNDYDIYERLACLDRIQTAPIRAGRQGDVVLLASRGACGSLGTRAQTLEVLVTYDAPGRRVSARRYRLKVPGTSNGPLRMEPLGDR